MFVLDLISWLVFFGGVFFFMMRYLRGGPATYSFESVQERIAFQGALNRIYISWSHETLEAVARQEIERYPKFQPLLTQAFKEQSQLLEDFYRNHPYALARVRGILQQQLEQCQSLDDFYQVRASCSEMAQRSGIIRNLLESYRLWFARQQGGTGRQEHYRDHYSHSKPRKKGLFSECRTPEEVKQRFRRLAFLNHPDRGGNEAAMKEVLRQYQEALDQLP